MAPTTSIWARAHNDTERFRKESLFWFWMVNGIFGASISLSGVLVGLWRLPENPSRWEDTLFPTVGGLVGLILGLAIPYLLVFILNLWLAPYRQRNELRTKYRALKTAIKPRLELIGLTRQSMENDGTAYALEIRNSGLGDVAECHGRLVGLAFEQPIKGNSLDAWPRNRDLHWSGQAEDASDYAVPASQSANLNVLFVYEPRARGRTAIVPYRDTKEFREEQYLPSNDQPLLMYIRISSPGITPMEVVLKVDTRAATHPIVAGLSKRMPLKFCGAGRIRVT